MPPKNDPYDADRVPDTILCWAVLYDALSVSYVYSPAGAMTPGEIAKSNGSRSKRLAAVILTWSLLLNSMPKRPEIVRSSRIRRRAS